MRFVVAMVIHVVGIVIQITSHGNQYRFLIGKFIAGYGVESISVLRPLFKGEPAPKRLRGALVYCFQLIFRLGIFLGYHTTYGTKNNNNSKRCRVILAICIAQTLFLI